MSDQQTTDAMARKFMRQGFGHDEAWRRARLLAPELVAEIVGPDGKVHYRRPPSHADVAEAKRTLGYSVRLVEVCHGR